MRITKFGHACVRLEHDDQRVVLDPGVFTDPEAVDGATSILITHEHPDHYSPENLLASDAPIYTIAAVASKIREEAPDAYARVEVVAPGQELDELGVKVIGQKHAVIYKDLPHFDNSGYLFDIDGETVFHPGDSLTLPGVAVDVLLLPTSAPWLKVSECITFAIDVGAPRNLSIHDAVYSDIGNSIVEGHLKRFLGERGQTVTRLAAGQDL